MVLIFQTVSFAQDINADLVDYYQKEFAHLSGQEIQALNQQELQALLDDKAERTLSNGRLGWITWEEAQVIAQWRDQHPVVGLHRHDHYDPENRIGFCFGRAMAVHLELIARGVSKDAIKKVFITPSILRDHFHVVTAVRGPDGVWWAFDAKPKPEKLTDWISRWKKDVGPKMKIHITDPAKFAGQAGRYHRLQFADSRGIDNYYKNYFLDFLKEYRQSLPGKLKFTSKQGRCASVHR